MNELLNKTEIETDTHYFKAEAPGSRLFWNYMGNALFIGMMVAMFFILYVRTLQIPDWIILVSIFGIALGVISAISSIKSNKFLSKITELQVTSYAILLKSSDAILGKINLTSITSFELNEFDLEDKGYRLFWQKFGILIRTDLRLKIPEEVSSTLIQWPDELIRKPILLPKYYIIPDIFEKPDQLFEVVKNRVLNRRL